MAKDSGLRIRVQRDLREQFMGICRAQDKPAAQVLRDFMRHYVEKHRALVPSSGAPSSRRRRAIRQ